MTTKAPSVCGRFAPTPSGPLHLGSLVTAVASYCDARSQQGEWLLRIEDLDTPRVVRGSADDILRTLDAFGFDWDGPVLYQSQRFDAYEEALNQLKDDGLIYSCECTRKLLHASNLDSGPLGLIYPGICRNKKLTNPLLSQRLNIQDAGSIEFTDIHYGPYELDLGKQVGDIILRRIDGVYAYHLAVVLDDGLQQVNQIVRGADLLEVTAVHLHLNQLLGIQPAQYLHIPLIKTRDGKKLSKQTGALALDIHQASNLLVKSLRFLGQPVESDLHTWLPRDILQYAVSHWQRQRIPLNPVIDKAG